MARLAEPWLWAARKGWYAWVGGKRCRLAAESEGKRAAKKRLNELIAEHERATKGGSAPITVGRLITEYLGDLLVRRQHEGHDHQTKADAERRMAGFLDMHGDRIAEEVKPLHVDEWLATRKDWGRTSRHDGVGAVKSAFKWAAQQGLISRNPLANMKKPPRAPRREVIPDPQTIAKMFAAEMPGELRDLLVFIFATGCRPKEARTTEARHVDRENGLVILSRHKTASKTGRKRVLVLPDTATPIVARLAGAHAEGPIFRNARGTPWTKDALVHAMDRLRRRAGLGKEVVAYSLRHAFATDALSKKISAAIVAELMGHTDLRMMGTYSHLSERLDILKDAAQANRGGEAAGEITPP